MQLSRGRKAVLWVVAILLSVVCLWIGIFTGSVFLWLVVPILLIGGMLFVGARTKSKKEDSLK